MDMNIYLDSMRIMYKHINTYPSIHPFSLDILTCLGAFDDFIRKSQKLSNRFVFTNGTTWTSTPMRNEDILSQNVDYTAVHTVICGFHQSTGFNLYTWSPNLKLSSSTFTKIKSRKT